MRFGMLALLAAAGTPGASGAQELRIYHIDVEQSAATIRNGGTAPVNLTNWLLRDLAGSVWPLSGQGILGAGQETTIRRNGMPMSLDNDGDTVELLDPTGKLADALTYLQTQPGVEIEHRHFE
jgi:hypothetical protein